MKASKPGEQERNIVYHIYYEIWVSSLSNSGLLDES